MDYQKAKRDALTRPWMKEQSKRFLIIASLSGFAGVALGAFGAHGLKEVLTAEMLDVFKTGVRYQMYNTFALIAIGMLVEKYSSGALVVSGWLFVVGIILFSGSLYMLALTQAHLLGLITPFGGLCFLAGWISMAIGIAKIKKEN